MESKGTFFILIIVVAVLALALAAIAGYLFLVQGSPANKGETAPVTSASAGKAVPEKTIDFPLYEGKSYFNLKNDDPKKIAMMQVEVVLVCSETLMEKENKKVVVEDTLNAYSKRIQELVVRFFLTKTIDDVKNIAVMDMAKEDLRKEINKLLDEGLKKPEDIVYEVVFSQWLFQ